MSIKRLREIVPNVHDMMGVKAVWGKIEEPLMCFGSRGNAAKKDRGHFQQARAAAERSITRPYLITIGGGDRVPAELRGRVLELVRVTGAYGETNAFARDPSLRARLAQWPVAVVLREVYEIVGDPDLIQDLGFPDRRILTNAYDGVKHDAEDMEALWEALKDWPVRLRREVPALPGFRDPGKAMLCSSQYPKVSAAEGERRFKLARTIERSPELRDEVRRRNRERNGGVCRCEACDWADELAGMFDVHHLFPQHVEERVSEPDDLALLCPTCHRWAHRKGESLATPVELANLRMQRARPYES